MTRATVITDASFCPDTNAGGWAAWVVLSDDSTRFQFSGPFKSRPRTNNIAELQATINGVTLAYSKGARIILAQTDCVYVFGKNKERNLIWNEAHKLYFPEARVSFRHVKGHDNRNKSARSWVNRWCDREAKKHMRKQREQA